MRLGPRNSRSITFTEFHWSSILRNQIHGKPLNERNIKEFWDYNLKLLEREIELYVVVEGGMLKEG